MADKNHKYCISMLHYHGFITRSDITSQFVGYDMVGDIGRADIFAARAGKAVSIEVKRGISSFPINEWRAPQRLWASWSTKPPFSVPYWIYLTLGKHPATYNSKSYMPRRTWLFPLSKMLEVIATLEPIQLSLVYSVKKGMRKEIQSKKLDAVNMLKDYELVWKGMGQLEKPNWFVSENNNSKYGGFWVLEKDHPFYASFMSDSE